MSYHLGDLTLPDPKAFNREQIETSAYITTINGTTKKDITNRKERYTIELANLTQTQVGQILGEWAYRTTRSFYVDEANLTIPATMVHIDIMSRNYNTKGGEYREDMTLLLIEEL